MGVQKLLVTGSNLQESRAALELCKKYQGLLYSTVGVHPCHATEIDKNSEGLSPEEYLAAIEKTALEGKKLGVVKAFGEIGLDYDRLHYAPADVQRKYFAKQLEIAQRVGLPLFLHSRACQLDFHKMVEPYMTNGHLPYGGVVHSFTGNAEELKDLLSLGFYIGINGCSLKTQENLDVVAQIPLDRIMLETDGPWCEIRPSHASFKQYLNGNAIDQLPFDAFKKEKFQPGSMVRGRCEPCSISLVARVVAGVKGITVEDLAEAAWTNTMNVFHFDQPET
jgi:TatD DNase family protein